MTNDVITVLVADDHAVVRFGVRQLLGATRDIRVVGEASDGREAVALAARLHPDVVLMDVAMAGLDGVAATALLKEQAPQTRVLMLTAHAEEDYLTASLRAGATGYVMKSAVERELVDAVRAVASGDVYVQPAGARLLARRVRRPLRTADERARLEALSPREREVLRMTAEGYGAPDIGHQLGISPKTVDTYRQRVNEKLGLASRPEYVRFALRAGLLVADGEPLAS